MTIQNGHDANVHTLHPTDNGIHHVKLIEVHPSNISLRPLPYSPRYLIPQFLPERIMVNVLLHRCCAARELIAVAVCVVRVAIRRVIVDLRDICFHSEYSLMLRQNKYELR